VIVKRPLPNRISTFAPGQRFNSASQRSIVFGTTEGAPYQKADVKSRRTATSWIRFSAIVLLGFAPFAHADTWYRAESPNFRIYSNIDAAETRAYVEQLEAFKYLADLLLGNNPKDRGSASRFTVYLVDSPDHFKTVLPKIGRYVGGFYDTCVEGAHAFAFAPQSYGAQMEFSLNILLHEYSHHLMFSRMRRFYPSWYVEGFAEYLGGTRLQNGYYLVGVRQDERAAQLNSSERWVDYDVMLDPKRFTAAVKKKQVKAFQYYAQSWITAHYMLSDSARAKALNSYFDRIARGEDGSEAFQTATGMTTAELRKEINSYRRKYSALQVKVPELPESPITVERLPKERGDYLLEAAALRTCPKKKHGAKLTEELRELHGERPGDLALRLEWSRAELLFGDAKAARTELESLVTKDPSSFDAHYLLGRSYFQDAKGEAAEHIESRAKAMTHFLEAYKLDKGHAPNLYYLSISTDTGDTPSKSTVNAATAAATLAPSVPEYALHAALVNLRAGDKTTAIRVLQPFANNPHKLEYAAQVAALINELGETEDMAEAIAKLGKLGLPPKNEEDKEEDKD
jgi:predicted Zn-dependent protease